MSSAESSSCVLISRRRRSEERSGGHPHYRGGAHTAYRGGDIFHNQNILYIDILQVKLFSNQLHITIMTCHREYLFY